MLNYFRSSLTLKVMEALICSQDWMRMSKTLVSVEESLEEIEKFEKGTLILFIVLMCDYLNFFTFGANDLSNLILFFFFLLLRVTSSWHGPINGIIKCQLI